MSGKNFIIFLGMIPLLLISGCSGKKAMEVNEAQNGGSIDMHTGDTLVIKLEGNPTTGYQWAMLPNTSGIIELQGEPAYRSTGNLVGSGGIYMFKIQAVEAGSTKVELKYYRSFEMDIPPIQTFALDINVK